MTKRILFLLVSIFIISCSSDSVPELQVTITLLEDGKVRVDASAPGAVVYRFSFGDSQDYIDQKSGTIEYTYKNKGDYVIGVRAFFDANDLQNNVLNTATVSITNAIGVGLSGEFIDDSEVATEYSGYTLVFSDEFNKDGAPSDEKWHLQYIPIQGGNWANGELQHYTTRRDNSYVSDGSLKIVAKRENYSYDGNAKNFTSARLNSKFDFQYGRVDVRAKLPSKEGTWPAIWTLGSNVLELDGYFRNSKGSVSWPECGEIDIMEQYGADKSKVLGTFHWRSESSNGHAMYPNDGSGLNVSGVSSEYHLYSLVWSASSMKIYFDDRLVAQLNNPSTEEEFRNPHYLLLNLAMGGSLGGTVPSNFDQDVLEIDYVRIYQ